MSKHKLSDIANIYSGYLFARRGDIDKVKGVKYRILSLSDMNSDGQIDYSLLEELQLKPIQNKYLARYKQVIIKCKGFNNEAFIIGANVPNNVVITSFYIIMEVDTNFILPEFLLYILNKKATQHQLGKLSKGTSIPNLTISTLSDLEIDLPDLEVQAKIADFYRLTITQEQLMKRLTELQKELNLEMIDKY